MKIYFAAPWFSPAQQEIHDRVLTVLDESDHKIFSPRRELVVKPDDPKRIRRQAFTGNLKAIDESDLVVAVTDYKDIGTIWEAGYAYRGLKAVLYYAETLGDRQFNLMLAESGIGVVRGTDELRNVLVHQNLNTMVRECMEEHDYRGAVE